uniref:Bifunctional inhibitor/plant lipid transfer protein/seed storage helical domain-containing protein n=1 Tax=Kalanchoe fedtschenkoi TaxID=63787 RepID=A0A7N0UFW2_KALFE
MKRGKLELITLILILASHVVKCQQWNAFPEHPLCLTQIGLLNHACAVIPIHSVPPPPPPSPPPANLTGHGRRHRHRRSHRHHHHHTPAEEECCRWLQQVDTECICELLVRLPIFLARPLHQYTLTVDDTCRVNYTCPSRIF